MSLSLPPSDNLRRSFATEVVARLRDAGFQALWAGGCVRDLILGHEPSDFDVATDATPDQVMSLFRRTVPVGVSFGVVRVLGPRGAGEIEVATFRTEGRYLDGRRPESVAFSSPREDASRRDFTINGMFLDPLSGEVIDYVGGQDDLRAGVIRAIGDPVARFEEDKLRLLRAVRFAARFGFALEPATRAAIVAMAEQVHVVAAERIAQELRRMLVHPSRDRGMALAFEVGLVRAILPELVPLEASDGLWERTLRRLRTLPESSSFPAALAALLHDIAVPVVGDSDVERLAELGGRMTDALARDLRLSTAERERAVWLVRHARTSLLPGVLPVAAYKRLLARPGLEELLDLQRAESLATGGDGSDTEATRRYLVEQPDGPIDPPPLVTGQDLIEMGLKPGPEFRRLLDAAYDAQLEGLFHDHAGAMAWLRARLDGSS